MQTTEEHRKDQADVLDATSILAINAQASGIHNEAMPSGDSIFAAQACHGEVFQPQSILDETLHHPS